jgi:hypothetical protein
MVTKRRITTNIHRVHLLTIWLKSDCLATDCLARMDTGLTLTPSFIPNSNYFITVGV